MAEGPAATTVDDWHDALAHIRARHRSGGEVNYIGGPADSITDGLGATSRQNGWWSRFAQSMATALGQPTRAIGSAEIAPDSTWPVWRIEGPATPSGRSLGRHGTALLRGSTASTEQLCDRVQLLIDDTTTAFNLTGGTLGIRVDGDEVARLDCGRADVVGRLWDSGPLGSFAPHRIELECVAGDFVSVGHSYFYDGDASLHGARFWRNAHAQFSAGRGDFGFVLAEATWTGPLTDRTIGRNPFNGNAIHGGGAITPDCFLCCTGTNDIVRCADDRPSVAALYVDLISYIRQRCGPQPSIGIVVPTAADTPGADYRALRDGVHDACTATGSFMIDLWAELGSHGDPDSAYYLDGRHPNDLGHAAWADHVARWMLQAVQADEPSAGSGGWYDQ